MIDFTKSLKKGILPFYYLYGDEFYYIDKAVELLKKKIISNEQNLIVFQGNVSPNEIVTSARIISVFGDNKLIIIKNFKKMDWQVFIHYFENPVASATLVFISSKYELPAKIKKIFEKKGNAKNFKKIPEYKLDKIIIQLFKTHGKLIGEREAKLIISYLGSDLLTINNEAKKLVMYSGKKDYIGVQDIKTVLEKSRMGTIFELINFLLDGNKTQAINLFNDLLENSGSEFVMVVMFKNALKKIINCKKLKGMGINDKEIGKALEIHPYFLKETLKRSENMSWNKAKKMYELLAWTENAMKFKKTSNKILVERLFYEI